MKQRYKQGPRKIARDPTGFAKIVIPTVRHDLVTEKHNDEKIAITLLIVDGGLIAYHLW